MKPLEFENTQGINLQYVVASTGERILAYVIDAVIMLLYFLITGLVFQPKTSDESILYTIFIALPVYFFYSLLFEWLNDGQSLGKMAMGLKVVRVDGRPVAGYDYLMRWIFRWLDIYATMGTLAAILVSATARGQRLGDILADTTVIQTRAGRISLKRVLKLGQLRKYEPKFPQVLALTEEQMMIVKEVLSRNKRNASVAHVSAVRELAERLRKSLAIEEKISDKVLLETLVKDFITLSR